MKSISVAIEHYHEPETCAFPEKMRFDPKIRSHVEQLLSESKKRELDRIGWEMFTHPSMSYHSSDENRLPEGAILVKTSREFVHRIIIPA